MSEATYLVGRGLSDITGEAAGCGMLGYGKADQQTAGIHTRQRSRAFVIAQADGSRRVLLIVNDLPLVFDSVHQAVLARLASHYGDVYTVHNTMITATHTHCGPGGYSHHLLYNTNTHGFRPKTFEALIDGMCDAAARAHDDLRPSTLVLSHGELHDASVNRSRASFERNPPEDRAHFPEAIDPQTTLLRIVRDGATVGAVNWFATHNTSMTNRNMLISSDNKGYAGWHWERVVHGLDYLSDPMSEEGPRFVGAFAQTNAGDMSPNLELHPGRGPTEDEFENARLIGLRQWTAAAGLATEGDARGRAVEGPVEARVVHVDLGATEVDARWCPDGKAHRTSGPAGGSASFAGAWADGPAFPGFREGRNPLFDWPSRLAYAVSPRLRDTHAPKGIVLPGARLNRRIPIVAQRVPVQLLRIGPLYLIGIPGEVTIVAGLRLRRAVADVVGASLEDVLVAGYSNGYIHYVTTPEEYLEQRYEGGSTLYGRWELPALVQTAVGLAEGMRDGRAVDPGLATTDLSARHAKRKRKAPRGNEVPAGRSFGDVVRDADAAYAPGQQVEAVFVGAHPANDVRRENTFLRVERAVDGAWTTIHDDGDWSTRFSWVRRGTSSEITLRWEVPDDAPTGSYRLVYLGDAPGPDGTLRSISGSTRAFEVTAGRD